MRHRGTPLSLGLRYEHVISVSDIEITLCYTLQLVMRYSPVKPPVPGGTGWQLPPQSVQIDEESIICHDVPLYCHSTVDDAQSLPLLPELIEEPLLLEETLLEDELDEPEEPDELPGMQQV
jgi:hypothetical protein